MGLRSEPKTLRAVRFERGVLYALDQTALPWREEQLELRSAADVVGAIRRLAIRGAPLIGVAGAYAVALAAAYDPGEEALERACALVAGARPTAVNLVWAVQRVQEAVLAVAAAERAAAALREAQAIEREEEAASEAIARHGADFLAGRRRILTHCNTGALAAPGRGTALAVIDELWRRGQLDCVIATESRPLLQGARLTTFELRALGIPHTLIVDSAAAGLMARGEADAVIVGADRIAANGDTANKVGTLGLALAAHAAGIPFVVAAPVSTIDASTPDGAAIDIEERSAEEVRGAGGVPLTLGDVACRNPAFDVTPARLISALVTDRGVTPAANFGPIDNDTLTLQP